MNRLYFFALTILLVSHGLAAAQPKKDAGKPLVYAQVNKESEQLIRVAQKVYANKFRFFEVNPKQGYSLGGRKDYSNSSQRLRDPRSMRLSQVPFKVSYAVIVTPEGKVIEPRILNSTDAEVSKYVIERIKYERYFASRWHGTPVYSLHVEQWKSGGGPDGQDRLYRDGLGVQGQHDRTPFESPVQVGPR